MFFFFPSRQNTRSRRSTFLKGNSTIDKRNKNAGAHVNNGKLYVFFCFRIQSVIG